MMYGNIWAVGYECEEMNIMTQYNNTDLIDLSEKCQSAGFAMALPTNFYHIHHTQQLKVLSDAYTVLIEYFGGVN